MVFRPGGASKKASKGRTLFMSMKAASAGGVKARAHSRDYAVAQPILIPVASVAASRRNWVPASSSTS
jgi:hypothetical protein